MKTAWASKNKINLKLDKIKCLILGTFLLGNGAIVAIASQ